MPTSIVIGNLVRGFTVIYGFPTEEAANTFVAENRKMIGSEYRLAPAMDVDLMPARALTEGVQDNLAFERAKPGELVEPSTGASIDVQDHNLLPPVASGAGPEHPPYVVTYTLKDTEQGAADFVEELVAEDAQHPNLPDPTGAIDSGHGSSGADSLVPGLHSAGGAVARPGQDDGANQPDSDRAAGDGGEGDLANEQ